MDSGAVSVVKLGPRRAFVLRSQGGGHISAFLPARALAHSKVGAEKSSLLGLFCLLIVPAAVSRFLLILGKSQRVKTQRVKTSENFAEEKNVRRRYFRRFLRR